MSNKDKLGREPVQLIEWKLPRCANVYGVAPCTASGPVGSECYNCLATCQDRPNYREVPLGNLQPFWVGFQGDGRVGFSSGDEVTIVCDIAFDLEPTGIVFEAGAGAFGIYIGFNNGDLIIRGGNGAAVPVANTVQIVVDPTPYLGKRYEIISVFERDSGLTLDVYLYDPVERILTYVGQDTASDASIHGSNDWGVGFNNLGYASETGNDGTDYNGIIYSVSYYDALPSLSAGDQFGRSVWFGHGDLGEPRDEVYILNMLESVSPVGSRINISGADDDYLPLGRRATMDFVLRDQTHSDVGEDPYRTTRLSDPRKKSTYLLKFVERQKFGVIGSRIVLHEGYAGQPLSDYLRRGYVFERLSSQNEEGLSVYCRDELARTEFLKTQVPVPSSGSLLADINDTDTSLVMSGEFSSSEYPLSGTVRINDELITYSGKTYDDGTNETTLTGLTRGTDGSTADSHSANDQVQICERFDNESVEQIIKRILQKSAKIEGQLIDLAGLAFEQETYLAAFESLSSLITVPVGADSLLGFLLQETSVYGWWDERAQQIRFKAIRAISASDIEATWTHEENIIFDTLTRTTRPRQRVNEVVIYYNPKNRAGDLDDETNYSNAFAGLSGDVGYGGAPQTRQIFARFLGSLSQANQTASRLATRYVDVPTEIEFTVDAKDRDQWTGDIVRISHPLICDPNGDRIIRRWLLIDAKEIENGDKVHYVALDVTLDGQIVVITENGIGPYTAALFAEGNAFITDNDGLNPDGTVGAKIT